VLAGTTTYGTQAAAEFLTREDLLKELLSRLKVKPGNPVPDFTAILSVNISDGVVLQSRILLAHTAS
jgi:hypothetical protein